MIEYTSKYYKRISKRKARKLYEQGATIRIIPHKLNPENSWGFYADIQKDEDTTHTMDFNSYVDCATFYNCNAETGKYLAYYVHERVFQTIEVEGGTLSARVINA